FFQAEDGIRDRNVTGVQTCALPICAGGRGQFQHRRQRGQGAAQLVGGVADERDLGGARGVEAGEHGVHRARQSRDLVLGLRDRDAFAPAGHGALGDARADRLHRPEHPALARWTNTAVTRPATGTKARNRTAPAVSIVSYRSVSVPTSTPKVSPPTFTPTEVTRRS